MPKKIAEYPRQVVIRLTTEQDTYLRDLAALHAVKVSDLMRAIIDSARSHGRVDSAIATIDRAYGEVDRAREP
jgi:hypothetical protein